MADEFASIHNHNEACVFAAVRSAAPRYPDLAGDGDLLADVACVALNHLPPRYIRHSVDYAFYLSESARLANEQAVAAAVDHAFDFVQARLAPGARG